MPASKTFIPDDLPSNAPDGREPCATHHKIHRISDLIIFSLPPSSPPPFSPSGTM
jgi:hypothetical protein